MIVEAQKRLDDSRRAIEERKALEARMQREKEKKQLVPLPYVFLSVYLKMEENAEKRRLLEEKRKLEMQYNQPMRTPQRVEEIRKHQNRSGMMSPLLTPIKLSQPPVKPKVVHASTQGNFEWNLMVLMNSPS